MGQELEAVVPVFFFLVVFPVAWILVCALLSGMSGHTRLLRRFPPVEDDVISYQTPLASGRGPWMVNFSNALTVRVGARGLHLAPNGLFRPPWRWGIPCIPWAELEYVGESPRLFWTGQRFRIPTEDLSWTVYGQPGEQIAAALVRNGRHAGLG